MITSTRHGMIELFLRAFCAGTLFAIMAGPLGSVIIWRRLAFFGDTIAHAALLGIAFSLVFKLPSTVGVLIVSLALAITLVLFSTKKFLAPDTLLAIFAHASLGLGLVALSLSSTLQIQYNQYLFGDVLSIDYQDIVTLLLGVIIVLITIWYFWYDLLTTTISEELAISEGISVQRIKLIFMILLALCVTVALKIFGALLITALLIIPAAAARFLAITPTQMMIRAVVVGIISVVIGLTGSFYFDIPTAPAIVCAAFFVFALARVMILRS
jgi:zinc transport system permease protein